MYKQSKFDLKDCSGCGRCREVCPAGIDIPKVLSIYSLYKENKNKSEQLKMLFDAGSAEDCIECGACSAHCEMGLPVKDIVREMAMLLCECKKVIGYNFQL